jgi:hypothetical protein
VLASHLVVPKTIPFFGNGNFREFPEFPRKEMVFVFGATKCQCENFPVCWAQSFYSIPMYFNNILGYLACALQGWLPGHNSILCQVPLLISFIKCHCQWQFASKGFAAAGSTKLMSILSDLGIFQLAIEKFWRILKRLTVTGGTGIYAYL